MTTTAIDYAANAFILIVVFGGMRLIYGGWPWQMERRRKPSVKVDLHVTAGGVASHAYDPATKTTTTFAEPKVLGPDDVVAIQAAADRAADHFERERIKDLP